MIVLTNCEGAGGMDAARRLLLDGQAALDAVEQGVRAVEADPSVRSVGRGGAPNLCGEMECDAAIMDGRTRMAGAVGALQEHLYAVSVARRVMERLPHVFLVGEGAARFARESGEEPCAMLTGEARREHEEWLARHVPTPERERWPEVPLTPHAWASAHDVRTRGTVVFLARDARGDLAVATSTSGWARKYPGRLGDTAVVGAGLYADNRYGACACTHTGEMVLRAGTARAVVLHMQKGASAEEACREAAADLRSLQGGLLGAVMIHAMDREGAVAVFSTGGMDERFAAHLWRAEWPEARRVAPQVAG